MKPIYRHRKAIFLALTLLLLENIAGTYFFDALSNVCANYRHRLEFLVDNRQTEPPIPVSTDNVKVNEGSNGTTILFIEGKVSQVFQIQSSGEYLDYSTYIQHLIFWKTLENIFNTIRDLHKEMSETIVYVFCIFLSWLGIEKLLDNLPKVYMKV